MYSTRQLTKRILCDPYGTGTSTEALLLHAEDPCHTPHAKRSIIAPTHHPFRVTREKEFHHVAGKPPVLSNSWPRHKQETVGDGKTSQLPPKIPDRGRAILRKTSVGKARLFLPDQSREGKSVRQEQ